jgi:hypothetical protein
VHGVGGARRQIRCHYRRERRARSAEANFLPFHVSGALIEILEERVSRCLCAPTDPKANDEKSEHHHEQQPALARLPYHAAEGVCERRGQNCNREHLDQVGERSGIFEGMRAVSVEEASAVSAQVLDALQRGHRPLCDHLGAVFQSLDDNVGVPVHRHTL